MPILPESVLTGPAVRITTGTMHVPQPHGREEPLMQSKVRGTVYPLYPLPQNKAHVPPPHAFETGGGGPPEARLPQRKQFPQNFNTGSHLLELQQHRAPYTIDLGSHTKRVLPPTQSGDLMPTTADFLHPYGHLHRETSHSIKDPGVIVGSLRGGVGYNTLGDKVYRQPTYSSGFHGNAPQGLHGQAKPSKWYTDPSGPQPKIQWLVGAELKASAGGSGRVTGRPLWQAPLSGGGSKGGGGKLL